MKEVRPPKRPLIFYYCVAMLILLLFNFLAMPWMARQQIQEVDYGTFMDMAENQDLGQVEIQEQENRILFTDKEETGSDGNTGLNSNYLKYFIKDLAGMHGLSGREVLSKSTCLSADVNAAYDPTFGDTLEKRNCAYLNQGVVVTQYTGARGKSGTSQASAEFMAEIRNLLDDAKVVWQTGELGKVDLGGGGTVAMYIAALNVDVVDVGVPVLSMHAPFEVVSKQDVYQTYRAFRAYIAAK